LGLNVYEPDEDEQGIGGRKKMMKRKEKCVGGSLLDLMSLYDSTVYFVSY